MTATLKKVQSLSSPSSSPQYGVDRAAATPSSPAPASCFVENLSPAVRPPSTPATALPSPRPPPSIGATENNSADCLLVSPPHSPSRYCAACNPTAHPTLVSTPTRSSSKSSTLLPSHKPPPNSASNRSPSCVSPRSKEEVSTLTAHSPSSKATAAVWWTRNSTSITPSHVQQSRALVRSPRSPSLRSAAATNATTVAAMPVAEHSVISSGTGTTTTTTTTASSSTQPPSLSSLLQMAANAGSTTLGAAASPMDLKKVAALVRILAEERLEKKHLQAQCATQVSELQHLRQCVAAPRGPPPERELACVSGRSGGNSPVRCESSPSKGGRSRGEDRWRKTHAPHSSRHRYTASVSTSRRRCVSTSSHPDDKEARHLKSRCTHRDVYYREREDDWTNDRSKHRLEQHRTSAPTRRTRRAVRDGPCGSGERSRSSDSSSSLRCATRARNRRVRCPPQRDMAGLLMSSSGSSSYYSSVKRGVSRSLASSTSSLLGSTASATLLTSEETHHHDVPFQRTSLPSETKGNLTASQNKKNKGRTARHEVEGVEKPTAEENTEVVTNTAASLCAAGIAATASAATAGEPQTKGPRDAEAEKGDKDVRKEVAARWNCVLERETAREERADSGKLRSPAKAKQHTAAVESRHGHRDGRQGDPLRRWRYSGPALPERFVSCSNEKYRRSDGQYRYRRTAHRHHRSSVVEREGEGHLTRKCIQRPLPSLRQRRTRELWRALGSLNPPPSLNKAMRHALLCLNPTEDKEDNADDHTEEGSALWYLRGIAQRYRRHYKQQKHRVRALQQELQATHVRHGAELAEIYQLVEDITEEQGVREIQHCLQVRRSSSPLRTPSSALHPRQHSERSPHRAAHREATEGVFPPCAGSAGVLPHPVPPSPPGEVLPLPPPLFAAVPVPYGGTTPTPTSPPYVSASQGDRCPYGRGPASYPLSAPPPLFVGVPPSSPAWCWTAAPPPSISTAPTGSPSGCYAIGYPNAAWGAAPSFPHSGGNAAGVGFMYPTTAELHPSYCQGSADHTVEADHPPQQPSPHPHSGSYHHRHRNIVKGVEHVTVNSTFPAHLSTRVPPGSAPTTVQEPSQPREATGLPLKTSISNTRMLPTNPLETPHEMRTTETPAAVERSSTTARQIENNNPTTQQCSVAPSFPSVSSESATTTTASTTTTTASVPSRTTAKAQHRRVADAPFHPTRTLEAHCISNAAHNRNEPFPFFAPEEGPPQAAPPDPMFSTAGTAPPSATVSLSSASTGSTGKTRNTMSSGDTAKPDARTTCCFYSVNALASSDDGQAASSRPSNAEAPPLRRTTIPEQSPWEYAQPCDSAARTRKGGPEVLVARETNEVELKERQSPYSSTPSFLCPAAATTHRANTEQRSTSGMRTTDQCGGVRETPRGWCTAAPAADLAEVHCTERRQASTRDTPSHAREGLAEKLKEKKKKKPLSRPFSEGAGATPTMEHASARDPPQDVPPMTTSSTVPYYYYWQHPSVSCVSSSTLAGLPTPPVSLFAVPPPASGGVCPSSSYAPYPLAPASWYGGGNSMMQGWRYPAPQLPAPLLYASTAASTPSSSTSPYCVPAAHERSNSHREGPVAGTSCYALESPPQREKRFRHLGDEPAELPLQRREKERERSSSTRTATATPAMTGHSTRGGITTTGLLSASRTPPREYAITAPFQSPCPPLTSSPSADAGMWGWSSNSNHHTAEDRMRRGPSAETVKGISEGASALRGPESGNVVPDGFARQVKATPAERMPLRSAELEAAIQENQTTLCRCVEQLQRLASVQAARRG